MKEESFFHSKFHKSFLYLYHAFMHIYACVKKDRLLRTTLRYVGRKVKEAAYRVTSCILQEDYQSRFA